MAPVGKVPKFRQIVILDYLTPCTSKLNSRIEDYENYMRTASGHLSHMVLVCFLSAVLGAISVVNVVRIRSTQGPWRCNCSAQSLKDITATR